jgi:hypothetical protein
VRSAKVVSAAWVQSFRFINGKNEASFHMKRNPRKLNWSVHPANLTGPCSGSFF